MSRVSACAAACSALFAFLLGLTGQSSAATFVVTTTADSNDGACTVALCSLRDAVIASNATAAPNVIALPAGHYTLTIPGAGEAAAATGDLNVTQDVTINGAGAATTIVDGNGLDRVFDVHASVVLNGLTITGGRAGSSQQGGGIRNDGDLTLNDCVVASNQAPSGGGIYSQVRLTLNNTSVVANVASGTGDGGGIANPFGGNATINSSRISGNSAALGGGLSNGGDATISDTTIAFNTVPWGLRPWSAVSRHYPRPRSRWARIPSAPGIPATRTMRRARRTR